MFRQLLKQENGQAMVEFALVVPLFLLLVFGIIEFGVLYNAQLSLEQDAREGARYAAIHGGAKSDADITSLVEAHLSIGAMTSPVIMAAKKSVDGSAITVTASTVVPALTPVGHVLFTEGEKELSAAVTMRME